MRQTVSFPDLIGQDAELIEILKRNDVPVLCRHKGTGKERRSRFSALYRNHPQFWQSRSWEFFITSEAGKRLGLILERERKKRSEGIKKITLESRPAKKLPPPFGEEYLAVQAMSMKDRQEKIVRTIEQLDEALDRPHISSHDVASLMTDGAIYSTVINKVSLEETGDQSDRLSREYMRQVTEKTEELMSSFVRALARSYNLNHTAETITSQTDGATSRHMIRVFIQSIRFLDDLRHEFEGAGLFQRLQSRLSSYFPLYEPLRERYPFVSFDKSMIMPEPPQFKGKRMEEIMLGILLHDLGKNKNLLYFDGGGDYDRQIIEDHAFEGYFMLMKKTSYRQSIASVAGLHHEYYGHERGYGVFRNNYSEYSQKVRSHRFEKILSHSYEDITSFRSVAFFPAKILEIVDVYDALIDKERLYKKPMKPGEALVFMRKTMIEEDLKLDPILFDLFIKFLKKAKLI
ncbi:MAG: hypothetical protein PQJ60_10640 [Spirochaetales bacterium]|nr:hypothetical protein [Spirochaetales bacterium]